jgi:hypothetical protein
MPLGREHRWGRLSQRVEEIVQVCLVERRGGVTSDRI